MMRYLTRIVVGVAVLLGAASGLSDSGGFPDIALAVSGCVDVDGDGTVHLLDQVMISDYNGISVPPAPPQVDVNKDGVVVIGDIGAPLAFYETATACQTDPLPKTTITGGALAVDATGTNTSASDPVESAVTALVGDSFLITIQLTSNPSIAGFQARLHWDEALLGLNERTAAENDLLSDVAPSVSGRAQALGPTDDGIGNEAYIELMATDLLGKVTPPTLFEGPVAQFEFTCEATGLAELTMSEGGGHTVLGARPATEYTPSVTNAVVLCFGSADGDGDGLPDSFEGDNACLDTQAGDAGADADGDGLDNLTEFGLVTNPCVADTDGDGLTDDLEVQGGTDPRNVDSDGDSLPDGYEAGNTCLDPLVDNADEDPDGDTLDNLGEFELGTNPCAANVGGVAELPAVAGAPLESGGGPGAGAGVLAGVAAAIAVSVVVLGGTTWYARRRWR